MKIRTNHQYYQLHVTIHLGRDVLPCSTSTLPSPPSLHSARQELLCHRRLCTNFNFLQLLTASYRIAVSSFLPVLPFKFHSLLWRRRDGQGEVSIPSPGLEPFGFFCA